MPAPAVGLVERPVERAPLIRRERAPGRGQHQAEQALQLKHALSERVALVGIRAAPRQVEGVDAVRRGARETDRLPAGRLADAAVLVLGVDDVVLDPAEQRPQRLHLAGVGLAPAALREDDLVGVLLIRRERVEDDERAVLGALPVEQPATGRERARGEGDHRRRARGVEVAAPQQVVLPGREAREQPRHHLVERRARLAIIPESAPSTPAAARSSSWAVRPCTRR